MATVYKRAGRTGPSMPSIHRSRPNRREVSREYGHPWPWQVRELVEEYAVERDVDLRDLADRWGCNGNHLCEWVRRHGYRTENYRAIR